MNGLQAMLIGLVEGISEYLPVSAAGHVIIVGNLMSLPADLVKSFGVALQAAPALAVLCLYWRRFAALLMPSSEHDSNFKGMRAAKLLSLGALPVLITGFLFKKYFYSLMMVPMPSVAGLAIGGIAILWAEARHSEAKSTDIEHLRPMQAFGIGLFQCLALWPGVSRSGATIIGGLLLGLNRKASAEFSFFVGVPVFLAASALEFHKSEVLRENLDSFGIAFAVSFACAALTVALLIRWLSKISFKPFGWYRLALAPLLYYYFR
jgi:undecaprenyl-diphosphatase